MLRDQPPHVEVVCYTLECTCEKCSFENVSSRCFCSSCNLLIMLGNHFLSSSEAVVLCRCVSPTILVLAHGLALLCSDAFWRPTPGSQECLPVLFAEYNGKGKSHFSEMPGCLVPRITQRAYENMTGPHPRVSGSVGLG